MPEMGKYMRLVNDRAESRAQNDGDSVMPFPPDRDETEYFLDSGSAGVPEEDAFEQSRPVYRHVDEQIALCVTKVVARKSAEEYVHGEEADDAGDHTEYPSYTFAPSGAGPHFC